jgi:hypothetical protein
MSPRTRAEILATLVYAVVVGVIVYVFELAIGDPFETAIFLALVGAVVSGLIWAGLFVWRRRSG